MQLLRVDAKQRADYPHEKRYAGACVDCYIKDQTVTNAPHVPRGWIFDTGWDAIDLEEQREITLEDYAEDSEGRGFFEQALTDEEVFVYYCLEREDDSSEVAADAPQTSNEANAANSENIREPTGGSRRD
jgi:hypothetical protein